MGAERDRVAGFGKLQDGLRQASDWYLWGPYVSGTAACPVNDGKMPCVILRRARAGHGSTPGCIA